MFVTRVYLCLYLLDASNSKNVTAFLLFFIELLHFIKCKVHATTIIY